MAEPVIISYARGLLKEFPGVPEGIVDVIPVDLVVGAIMRGRRPRARRRGRPTSSRSRRARRNPLRTGASSTSCSELVHRAPALRHRRPADRRARVVASPAGAGCRASSSGPRRSLERAEKVLQALPLRGKQAELVGAARGAARARPSGPSPTSSSTAPTPSARRSTASTACSRCGTPPRRRRPERLRLRPPRSSTGTTTSARSTCRRSSSTPGCDHAGQSRTESREHAAAAPGARRPSATSPPSTSRTRSSRRTSSTSLLVAGHPPAAAPTTGCASSAGRWRRRPALLALDRKDRSDFLRFFYRRYEGAPVEQLDEDAAEMFSDADPHQVVPRRHPPGARAPARSVTARCSSPAPSTSWSSRCARCSTTSSRAEHGRQAPTAPTPASSPTCRRPARRGPSCWSTTPTPKGLDLAESRSPTPTRPRDLPDARGGRLPGGRQPRDPAGRPRPQARLAGRALGEGAGRPAAAAADRPGLAPPAPVERRPR